MNLRPRISILTALLLTTIVGMVIALVQQSRALTQLRSENQALRVEVGVLDVTDADQVHVVRVKEAGGFRWNWRVWLPPGKDYWFHAAHNVPANGITQPNFTTFIGIGGQEISIHVEVRPAENGKRHLYLKCPAADCPFFDVDEAAWLNGDTMIGDDVAGEKSQQDTALGEPAVLLRLTEHPAKSRNSNGVLLWISDKR